MRVRFHKLYRRGRLYVKPLLKIIQLSPNGDQRVYYQCVHVYKTGVVKSPYKSERIAREKLTAV